MNRSCFLAVILLSALILSLPVPQGHGRRIRTQIELETGSYNSMKNEESSLEGREMMEMVMDYKEPGANNNTRNGALFNSSPPPMTP